MFGQKMEQERTPTMISPIIREALELLRATIPTTIEICQEIAGRELNWKYSDQNRIGDHIWWISDLCKFKNHFPDWRITYNVPDILQEIYQANVDNWIPESKLKSQLV